MKGFARGFPSPGLYTDSCVCFTLLFLHYLSFLRSWPTILLFILFTSPREVSTVTNDDTRYERILLYTTTPTKTSRHSTTRYQKSYSSSGRPHDFNDSSLRLFTTTTTSTIIIVQRPCCLYCRLRQLTLGRMLWCAVRVCFPPCVAPRFPRPLVFEKKDENFHYASCLVLCNTTYLSIYAVFCSSSRDEWWAVDR